LDSYLGELNFVSNIDNIQVIGKQEAKQKLMPIAKLKDFLIWRQEKFIEKYENIRYNTKNDEFSILENENKLVAAINTKLLNWDNKPSHPWVAVFVIRYDGSNANVILENENDELIDEIEDKMSYYLTNKDGYLKIGVQTVDGGGSEFYYACKDFRKISKVFFEMQQKYADKFGIEYHIYKDKYWKTFEKFNQN
jgi:hypothetical protein